MESEKYQVLPPLPEQQYESLKADIAENGVLVPVEYDEDGNILDGFHRVRACRELDIEDWPSITRMGLTESEKRTHARRVNMNRRHLSRDQKREQIRAQLKDTPRWSNNRIAQALGVSDMTVGSVRTEMERDSELPKLGSRVGSDGVERPAEMPDNGDKTARPSTAALFAAHHKEREEQTKEAKRVQAEAPGLMEQVSTGKITVEEAKRELDKKKRRRERVNRAKEASSRNEDLPLDKRYPVIYADPPWRYEYSPTGNRKVENHYPTMSLEEICELPVEKLATPDAVLFLWATSPKLLESLQVIEAWGFQYRTCMVWVKDKIGMGYYARQQHELLLIAKHGSLPVPKPEHRPGSAVFSPRLNHSKKPAKVYGLIERMYPEYDRIELFARQRQPNWEVWGNEAGV